MPDARTAIHIALTAVMGWFALILTLPGDTLASPGWRLVATHMTEGQLAMASLTVAFIGVCGLLTNSLIWRWLSTVVLSLAHGLVGVTMLMSNPAGTGSGTYLIVALQGAYLVARRTGEG